MLKLKHIESATVALLLLFAAVHTLAQYEDGQPGDFGESLAYSAVNLNAAHGGDDDAQDEQQRLESLLHWSISNSDPQALRDAAVEATKREAVQDLLEQRKRVRELLDYMNAQPTETDMLKEAIGLVSDLSKSDAVRLHALKAMQSLVEPIDNANDLRALKGIAPVVAHLKPALALAAGWQGASLGSEESSRRPPSTSGTGGTDLHGHASMQLQLAAAAAHVLGSAASNNPTFQSHIMQDHPDIFRQLLDLSMTHGSTPSSAAGSAAGGSLPAADAEAAAGKALYAVSAMARNTRSARGAFARAGGMHVLETLLRGASTTASIKRRALSLLLDILDTAPSSSSSGGGGGGGGSSSAHGLEAQMMSAAAAAGQGISEGVAFTRHEPGAHADVVAGAHVHGDGEEDAGDLEQAWTMDVASASVSTGLPEAVVVLLREGDADMREKALLATRRIARHATAASVLRSHGADSALATVESELQQELEQRMKRNKAPRSIQGYSLREKEENASEDEEDDYSYQEYLLKLVREVQALLAQARTETMQEGGRTLGKEGAGHKFGATAAEGIELEQGDGGLDAKLQVGGRRVQGAAEPPMALGGPAGSQPANLDFKANHEGNQLAAPLQLGSGKGSDGLGVRKGAECAPSSAEGMCIAYEAESSANIEN